MMPKEENMAAEGTLVKEIELKTTEQWCEWMTEVIVIIPDVFAPCPNRVDSLRGVQLMQRC